MGNSEYEFEMYETRKQLLRIIAECARDGDLFEARRKCRKVIRRNRHCDMDDVKHFTTAFENARDIVEGNTDARIEIEDMPSILNDHDGKISPSQIDGEATEVIRSIKPSDSWHTDEEVTVYPVYTHKPSGYRVCSCPSQAYSLVCKHTMARVIERNSRQIPTTA